MADDGKKISELPPLNGGFAAAVSNEAMLPLALGTGGNARIGASGIAAYINQTLSNALSGKAEAADLERLRTDFASHVNNGEIHITQTERAKWDGKQDKLTAGSNITIANNVISAAGGSNIPVPVSIANGGTNASTKYGAIASLFEINSPLILVVGVTRENGTLRTAFRGVEDFLDDNKILTERDGTLNATNTTNVDSTKNYSLIIWNVTADNQTLSLPFDGYRQGDFVFVRVVFNAVRSGTVVRANYTASTSGGWESHAVSLCQNGSHRIRVLIFVRSGLKNTTAAESGLVNRLQYIGSFWDD